MRRRGKILAVKWGYNPNSSSLGVDVTFLLFGMAAIALLTPLISLFLRTRKKHRINVDYDAILDAVAVDTKDTDLGYRWRLKIGSGEAREVREILLKFVATLPERQRIVAQCFIDNFEMFRPRAIYKPLADAVSAVTGITESVADVKNDWRYARAKIIAELERRGYTYITVE